MPGPPPGPPTTITRPPGSVMGTPAGGSLVGRSSARADAARSNTASALMRAADFPRVGAPMTVLLTSPRHAWSPAPSVYLRRATVRIGTARSCVAAGDHDRLLWIVRTVPSAPVVDAGLDGAHDQVDADGHDREKQVQDDLVEVQHGTEGFLGRRLSPRG